MKRYNKEFKEEAIKLSDEIGLKKAVAQLGIEYNTLAEWRKSRNKKSKEPINQLTDEEADKRIKELEKELNEVKQANEILKDALGFFAKDRKK